MIVLVAIVVDVVVIGLCWWGIVRWRQLRRATTQYEQELAEAMTEVLVSEPASPPPPPVFDALANGVYEDWLDADADADADADPEPPEPQAAAASAPAGMDELPEPAELPEQVQPPEPARPAEPAHRVAATATASLERLAEAGALDVMDASATGEPTSAGEPASAGGAGPTIGSAVDAARWIAGISQSDTSPPPDSGPASVIVSGFTVPQRAGVAPTPPAPGNAATPAAPQDATTPAAGDATAPAAPQDATTPAAKDDVPPPAAPEDATTPAADDATAAWTSEALLARLLALRGTPGAAVAQHINESEPS